MALAALPRAGRGRWQRARGRTRPTSPAVQLGLAAASMAAIYAGLLVAPLPLWAGRPQSPPAPGATAPASIGWPGLLIALGFALAVCGPFRPYLLALRTAQRGLPSTRLVVGLTVLLAGTA